MTDYDHYTHEQLMAAEVVAFINEMAWPEMAGVRADKNAVLLGNVRMALRIDGGKVTALLTDRANGEVRIKVEQTEDPEMIAPRWAGIAMMSFVTEGGGDKKSVIKSPEPRPFSDDDLTFTRELLGVLTRKFDVAKHYGLTADSEVTLDDTHTMFVGQNFIISSILEQRAAVVRGEYQAYDLTVMYETCGHNGPDYYETSLGTFPSLRRAVEAIFGYFYEQQIRFATEGVNYPAPTYNTVGE